MKKDNMQRKANHINQKNWQTENCIAIRDVNIIDCCGDIDADFKGITKCIITSDIIAAANSWRFLIL